MVPVVVVRLSARVRLGTRVSLGAGTRLIDMG